MNPDTHSNPKSRLRLLSYNIQVAVASTRLRHYITQCWKHVLPHPKSLSNLDRIAEITSDYDIVALQEVDAGSIRSQFINQAEYIADKAGFPFWYHQTNRNLGKFAQHSNGFLSHIQPAEITEHKLPGLIPGRGAIVVRFGPSHHHLVLILAHLALGMRARMTQLSYIAEIANQHEHVVLMGDLNCQPHSREIHTLLHTTKLCPLPNNDHTFPSWQPTRKLDYILTTPGLKVHSAHVLRHAISDHLPLAVEISLPEDVNVLAR
jgi:endonuclease/exonuclease/phosphatase family metal-dependent hydrolase